MSVVINYQNDLVKFNNDLFLNIFFPEILLNLNC